MTRIRDFLSDETGAVTADWMILTGIVVGVMLAAVTTIKDGTADHGDRIGATYVERGIPTYGVGTSRGLN